METKEETKKFYLDDVEVSEEDYLESVLEASLEWITPPASLKG